MIDFDGDVETEADDEVEGFLIGFLSPDDEDGVEVVFSSNEDELVVDGDDDEVSGEVEGHRISAAVGELVEPSSECGLG